MPERRLDDDDTWEVHRGRLTPSTSWELRRAHDPLVRRVLELRAARQPTAAERRLRDAESYGPAVRRQQRAQRSRERREAALTPAERSARAQHQADLQRALDRHRLAESS